MALAGQGLHTQVPRYTVFTCLREPRTGWSQAEVLAARCAPGADSEEEAGAIPPLGISCLRDRVAQMAAMLVLSPIFEADLQPEQHASRAGRSVLDAVQRVHRLVNQGHREIVDGDLSIYFAEIPHTELLRSVARRVSDGCLLGWVGSSDG